MGRMFDDFDQVKKLKDPEERKAQELNRSKKRIKRHSNKRSSVSMNTVNASLIVVSIITGLVVAAIVACGIYFGVQLYLNGW